MTNKTPVPERKEEKWKLEVWWPAAKESHIFTFQREKIIRLTGKKYANMRVDKVLELLGVRDLTIEAT